MIKYSKAALKDLESIVSIEQQVFHTDSYPPFVIRQLFDISGDYIIVAKETDKVLGYVIGGINTDKKEAWVLSLGVHPDARGKGIGKKLMDALIKIFNAQSTEQIALTVYPDNAAAIKIYKDLGFEGDTILDNYFLDNEKRIVMTLKTKNP